MPNRLAHETSPYLLQHQHNPVAWYAWGEEALERAKAEQRPIFLSIGYSACHWCHVMEHESFENEQIAQLLNDRFVCIKVDREERPDLDQIYMTAVQLLTGRGGWPMSVFLTPELQPFYGGTYWPPHDSRGMPGFDRIILAVHDAWQNRREQAIAQAASLTEHIQALESEASSVSINESLLRNAAVKLERVFDFRHGGFGNAPKFPHSMDLQLLLRVWQREPRAGVLDMVQLTLQKMADGGIYDHLGGGFARYSVDEHWLVPHFEKMLYDNALLTLAYLEAYVATGEERYARIVREICDYILRAMTDPQGGFFSTEDADSEGVEGKFYVWTAAEIGDVLGAERGRRFCQVYGVTESGNFEHGWSILHLPQSIEQVASQLGVPIVELETQLAEDRAKLFAVRKQRVRPGLDDKILVSWNALMIDALARAAGVLSCPAYLTAAERAADFTWQNMRDARGRLLHTWRKGQAKLNAYLDDYAYFLNACVSLYEASFQERWLGRAVALADDMLAHFADPAGGFYFTANDHEQLIARQKDLQDSSVPSGNSMAAYALQRLGSLTHRDDYLTAAAGTLQPAVSLMEKSPTAAGQMLLAADWHIGPSEQWVFVGDPTSAEMQALLAAFRKTFRPRSVVACATTSSENSPLAVIFAGRTHQHTEPALYVCRGQTCEAPVLGKEAILTRIARV
jgi:uncharacterized protein